MSTKIGGFLLLLGWTAVAAAAQSDAQSRSRTLRDPELHSLYHYDVSRPLREMPVIPPTEEEGEWRLHPVKLIRPPRAVPRGWVDPLARAGRAAAALAPQVATTPGLSFDGVGVGLGSFSPTGAPPDTNGAPGPTQYVQWVNTSFAVFDKSTGVLVYGPAAGNTLWQGFGGPCETTNSGDPVVIYDKAAGRWVMTQFSINQSTSQFYQCVAVSTTSDATGTYRRFAYNFAGFNDYPKGGVWPDGYYLTFNMFNAAGTAFTGARVCALDRNQMITAAGAPGPIQCFQLSTTYGGLLPADLDGATPPPAGAPNYMVAFDDTAYNGLNLWKFHVDWTNSANSTLTGPTKITTAAFSPACGGGTCIPQPSTTQQLDSLADRLMFRLAYRNFGSYESLVVNHSVTVGSTASGVRWYEVRSPGGTPTLFQSGTFSPDATARWMGSIAQDQQGNMLLGYSASSSSVRPGIRYTGRLVSDAPGTMQAENTLTTGVGSQTGSLSRWGDYSAMTDRPGRRLHVLVHEPVPEDDGQLQLEHPHRLVQVPGLRRRAHPRLHRRRLAQLAQHRPRGQRHEHGDGDERQRLQLGGEPVLPGATRRRDLRLQCGLGDAAGQRQHDQHAHGWRGGIHRRGQLLAPGDRHLRLADARCAGLADGHPGGRRRRSADRSLRRDAEGAQVRHGGQLVRLGPVVAAGPRRQGSRAQPARHDQQLVRRRRLRHVPLRRVERPPQGLDAGRDGPRGRQDGEGRGHGVGVDVAVVGPPGPVLRGERGEPGVDPDRDADADRGRRAGAVGHLHAADGCAAGGEGSLPLHRQRRGLRHWRLRRPRRPRLRGDDDGAAAGLHGLRLPRQPDHSPGSERDEHGDRGQPERLQLRGEPVLHGPSGRRDVCLQPGLGDAAGERDRDERADAVGGRRNRHRDVRVFGRGDERGDAQHALSLTVTPPGGGPQTATYDATLKAPKCAAVGSSCDSGPSLLLGRDGRGPEPNPPNTINSSCADGTSGTFHSDESTDRIKVSTVDGTSFAAGKTVRIDATVWAWTTPSADHLDLYYAANAASPTWTFIATLTPTAAGAQTLSATYALPAGTLQAVRAQFRYQGSASACTSGSYNDRDDLIFAVP